MLDSHNAVVVPDWAQEAGLRLDTRVRNLGHTVSGPIVGFETNESEKIVRVKAGRNSCGKDYIVPLNIKDLEPRKKR